MLYAFVDAFSGEIGITNFPPEGETYYAVPAGTDPGAIYIKDDQVKWYPPKPDEYHVWDAEGEFWADQHSKRLPEIKAYALSKINETTSQVRDRFVSPISSQSTVYELKRQQAVAFLSDDNPTPEEYPLVFAEAGPGLTAPTPYEVCQTYLNLNAVFLQALATVDGIRISFVNAIEAATTKAEVDSALVGFEEAIGNLPF